MKDGSTAAQQNSTAGWGDYSFSFSWQFSQPVREIREDRTILVSPDILISKGHENPEVTLYNFSLLVMIVEKIVPQNSTYKLD